MAQVRQNPLFVCAFIFQCGTSTDCLSSEFICSMVCGRCTTGGGSHEFEFESGEYWAQRAC